MTPGGGKVARRLATRFATREDRLRSAPGILRACAEVHVMNRTDEGWRVHARVGRGKT